MQPQINIKTMPLVDLKALAFDQGQLRDMYQGNLNIINQEIKNRMENENAPIPPVEEVKEEAPVEATEPKPAE